MAYITLTTDFGTRDGNVGVMYGVIWGIAPDAQIADLSHEIEPQNIRQANFILDRQAYYFPENTIHVVVVDPGVGTRRQPIAAQIGPQRFVGPDNGVFTAVLARAERNQWPVKIVHTDKPKYWLPKVSDIFHGRDIFSPVAAHWAAGVPLEELGAPVGEPVRISLPQPTRLESSVTGEVIHIDRFGNVVSNIHRDDLLGINNPSVSVSGATLTEIIRTFGLRPPGELIALYSSTDYVMVSVVNGNAARRIDAKIGDTFEVTQGDK